VPEFWSEYLPYPWNIVAAGIVAAALLFGFIGGSTFFAIWAERKVSGRIQDRLGPTRVGPFGLLQSLADGIKLISKEDFAPIGADRFLFKLAPYLAFCASFVGFLALPFGRDLVGQNLDVAAFFMLAVLSSEVFGVVLAGYASASKWSLFGGVREAAQVVSYEVPRAMCVIVPICVAGTLNLNVNRHAANRLVLELESVPRSVHVPGVLHLLHLRRRELQACPVRPRRSGKRTRRGLPHGI